MLNDDVLTSVSNATLVLLDGSDIERLAVLFQFPQFLEHCPDDTLQIMVPEICRDAVRWKEEVQMAAAEALYFVVNMRIPETVAKRIVIAALRIIQMSESGDVFDAWGEILSMMLPQVKREDVLSLVVPATVDRATSTTVESRRLAARIIGSLNDSLTSDELEDKFLQQAIKLCGDEDASVRAMIAQSLASVGAKLPLKISENHLWPVLSNLMSDDNARVRAAAMRAVARSAEAHKDQCQTASSYKATLLPMFMKECETAIAVAASDLRTVDDDTYLMLEIFSEVFGYFLCAVNPLFKEEDKWNTALNALRRMVTCNGPTVRHWCAFNVPAVSLVCGISRPEKIRGVVHSLSTDTDVETRATLAAGIHETTRILAQGSLRQEVLAAIAELMTDQNPQVRMNALGHFAELLRLLSVEKKAGDAKANDKMSARQLAPIFKSLETMAHDSWRTQELLAKQLDECAYLVPQDMLCEHVAPLLFQMARESTFLVRKSSMSALVSVIRYIPDVRRRDHILKHFRSEWARGKVYWTRLSYIDGSTVALKALSNRLFTQLFASELLSLSRDPVANVRLRLVRLMPEIADACGGKSSFAAAMETMLADEDTDVRQEAQIARDKIAVLSPKTADAKASDAEKEASERKFFVQRKRKNPTKGTKLVLEDSAKPDFQKPIRRNASFTNNVESASGAKQTVVVHSVLGAAGAAATMTGGLGLGDVEGNVLAAGSSTGASNSPTQTSTTVTDTTFGSASTNGPSSVGAHIDRKNPQRTSATRPVTRKRGMCGCFG